MAQSTPEKRSSAPLTGRPHKCQTRSWRRDRRGPIGDPVNHQITPATVAKPTYTPTAINLSPHGVDNCEKWRQRKPHRKRCQEETIGSLRGRGGCRIASRSGGLNPRAIAGGPSVTKFTQSSWTGMSASGTPMALTRNTQTTSPIFELHCLNSGAKPAQKTGKNGDFGGENGKKETDFAAKKG
jgi:hypothetical protein